jgi:hypothetical protein
MDREKNSGRTLLFGIGTIEAMDGTEGEAQAKLSLLRTWTTVPAKHKHGRYY